MDILNFINTVGFPIFVAVFFLLKLDKTLQNIGKSVNDLTEIIKIKLNTKDWFHRLKHSQFIELVHSNRLFIKEAYYGNTTNNC